MSEAVVDGCAVSVPSASRSPRPMPTRSTTGSPISSGARASRCWRWRASVCSASASRQQERAGDHRTQQQGHHGGRQGRRRADLLRRPAHARLRRADREASRHPGGYQHPIAFWKAMRLAGDSAMLKAAAVCWRNRRLCRPRKLAGACRRRRLRARESPLSQP